MLDWFNYRLRLIGAMLLGVISLLVASTILSAQPTNASYLPPVLSLLLLDDPAFTVSDTLNDTGITWGGDYPSGNNATCTSNIISPQDCNKGRDATHNDDSDGHAGFSYTKLSSTGVELDASAASWSCVKDNVTGLMWEVKTNDRGIHYKYTTYPWGGIGHEGSNYGTYYPGWDTLVNGSNAGSGLCGYTDWRVPSISELESLTNFNRTNPPIDITYFPNTPYLQFWSTSPSAIALFAWYVDFSYGYSHHGFRHYYHYVRLVRSGQ